MAEDVPDIPKDVVPSSKPIDFYVARQGVLISSCRVLGPAVPGLVCLWTAVTRAIDSLRSFRMVEDAS